MTDPLPVLVSAALVNNLVLSQFLGADLLFRAAGNIGRAVTVAVATGLVLVAASVVTQLIGTYLLYPLALDYLVLVSFVLLVATLSQLVVRLLRQLKPLLHQSLGGLLPWAVGVNSLVLGVALLNVNQQLSLVESLYQGLGAALGFALVLAPFAALQERIAAADIPAPFRGSAIALITAGIVSLAFMGFTGMAT